MYRAAADAVRREHGYGSMMVNVDPDPCDDNHSDDEEAFLPYTYALAFEKMGRKGTPNLTPR